MDLDAAPGMRRNRSAASLVGPARAHCRECQTGPAGQETGGVSVMRVRPGMEMKSGRAVQIRSPLSGSIRGSGGHSEPT